MSGGAGDIVGSRDGLEDRRGGIDLEDLPVPGDEGVVDPVDVPREGRGTADQEPDCPTSNAPPGCPCVDNTDCASGFCVMHLGEKLCTAECIEECPPGYSCEEMLSGGMDTVFICVSDFPSLCLPCATDQDCDSAARCVWYGPEEGTFCGALCSEADGCPDGYECEQAETVTGATVGTCVLAQGVCPCTAYAVTQHLWSLCESVNGFGACPGTRECGAGGLTLCTAPAPAKEFCNDLDDDCDGVTDEPPACDECMCGDGDCVEAGCHEGWKEGLMTCAPDCAVCGNGLCDPGEGPVKCPEDCCGGCGDGLCKGGECGEDTPEDPAFCPSDCGEIACGDAACEPGENPVDCPEDCGKYICGNGTCEPGENPLECPEDCAEGCGNCECTGGESYTTCPIDCGYCGDGYCIDTCPYLGETAASCPLDCCFPNCAGKECGPDGCGGSCGSCPGGVCAGGVYVTPAACVAGTCLQGQQVGCDDQDPCTTDGCEPQTGCVHAPAPGQPPCASDGVSCTTDVCSDGVCMHIPQGDWKVFDGHCYIYITQMINGYCIYMDVGWVCVLDMCKMESMGHLVTVSTIQENSFVAGLGPAPFWIGLFGQVNFWYWVTQEPFIWSGWNPGEPNGGFTNTWCVEMLQGGKWNDIACYVGHPYVCEKDQ
ncbi:MAG: C-type lectin domain-containing protein [Pseudomonadota bacterium]